MNRSKMFAAAAFVMTLIGVAACSDATSPKPTALLVIRGNNAALASGAKDTLVVRVYGDNATPVEGVTVRWTLNTGEGTLSSETSVSNVDGDASVIYTPSANGGAAGISASYGEFAQSFSITSSATAAGGTP